MTDIGERIVREKERRDITGISRAGWYNMTQRGDAPAGLILTGRSVGWLYTDLMIWVSTRSRKSEQGGKND
jgi:prophage regulatory protein